MAKEKTKPEEPKQNGKVPKVPEEEIFLETREPVAWVPDPPDGGWGWLVVFGAFMIHVIADGIVYSFGIMVVKLLEDFHEGRGLTSWIVSTLVGLTLGVGPLASALTNRFGCRFTTMLGSVIAAAGCAISFFANSILFLMISVGLIMGLGFGLIYCPAMIIVTVYFDDRRALATGIAVCGAGIGTFIFAPLTTFLVEIYGWRGAFLIDAGLVLNCAVMGALFRPVPMKPVYETEEVELQPYHSGSVSLTHSHEGLDNQPHNNHNNLRKDIEAHILISSGAPTARFIEGTETGPHSMQNSQNNLNHKVMLPRILIEKTGNGLHHSSSKIPNGTTPGEQEDTVEDRLFCSAIHLNEDIPTRVTRATSTLSTLHHGALRNRRPTFTHQAHRGRGFSESSGILNLPDVFYPGSTRNISDEYHHHRDIYRSLAQINAHHPHQPDAGQAVRPRRLPGHSERSPTPVEEYERAVEEEEDGSNFWVEMKNVLRQMANLSLLKDPIFLIFAISNFLTSMGFNAPLIFLPDKAHNQYQLDEHLAGLTLAGFGIANTVARVFIGLFCDKQFPCRYGKDIQRNRFWTYTISITLCGLLTLFSFLCTDFVTLMIYSSLFGVTLGVYVALTSVILVDLLGIEKLTNAFGLLLLFQGIASLIGPPITGYIFDITKNYDHAFYFAGASILVSGVLMVFIPFIEGRIRSESFIRRVKKEALQQ